MSLKMLDHFNLCPIGLKVKFKATWFEWFTTIVSCIVGGMSLNTSHSQKYAVQQFIHG